MNNPTAEPVNEQERTESLKLLGRYREKGVENKRQVEVYDETSAQYEKCLGDVAYSGPHENARTMEELFPHNRNQVKILDAAAGTGLGGLEMFKSGFTNLDAIDAAPGMLAEAKKKNIYQKLICEYIGENKLPVKERIYDAVTMCGWLAHTQAFFQELVSVIKPGGVLVNVTRIFGTYTDDSKWKLESTRFFPNFYFDSKGAVYVYRII